MCSFTAQGMYSHAPALSVSGCRMYAPVVVLNSYYYVSVE